MTTESFECVKCCKYYKTYNCLLNHINRTHGNSKLPQCSTCEETYSDMYCLSIRTSLCAKTRTKRTNLCPVCDKYCDNKKKLRSHMIDHYNIGGFVDRREFYKCVICNQQYTTHSMFINHVSDHINNEDIEQHNCKVCNNPDSPAISKINKCNICANMYKHKSRLQIHMKNKHPTIHPTIHPTEVKIKVEDEDMEMPNY